MLRPGPRVFRRRPSRCTVSNFQYPEFSVGIERFVKIIQFAGVVALCTAALAGAAQAQGNIFAGQTVSGRLDTSDYLRDDGTYYDDWFYDGRAGETITVTQGSAAFDSWLLLGRVVNGAFNLEEFNDDGAGGNDSRITYTLPADGRYVIRANVVGRGRTGSYTLRVDRAGGGSVSRSAGNRVLSAGQFFSGELDSYDPTMLDKTHYELWRYHGRAGEQLTIIMRSSSFDSYMSYGRMNGDEYEYIGGSSGRTVNGQQETVLSVTLPSTGEFGIRANSHGVHSGRYTLAVTSNLSGSSTASTGSRMSGSLDVNATVSGQLDSSDLTLGDGTFYDIWRFTGRAGQRVRITMRSDDFDTFLSFGTMDGGTFNSVETDDDSGEGTNSMIEITLTAGGEYVIRANSLSEASGRYTLTVLTL